MRILTIILTFFLLVNTAFAQYYRVERFENSNRRLEVSGGGNDSICTMWYESGARFVEGRYMFGKMIGAWHYSYESGKPQMTMYFDSLNVRAYKDDKTFKGKLIKSVSQYETGELEKIDNYNNGKHLFTTAFYPNGKVKELITYVDEIPATGVSWYENGSVKEMFNLVKKYTPQKTGGKKETMTVTTEPLVYKRWHENGQIALDGQLDAKGNKTGTWKQYDDQGNVTETIEQR
jgi:antitoxin component YwqK of YwqJK toxin-antitoxin module